MIGVVSEPSYLKGSFNALYEKNSRLFNDVTFVIPLANRGLTKIGANRYALAATSRVFFSMFENNPDQKEFKLDHSFHKEFRLIVQFSATGCVDVPVEQCLSTHFLACKYDIEPLAEQLSRRVFQEINEENVLDVLDQAVKFESHEVLDKCGQIIQCDPLRICSLQEKINPLRRDSLDMLLHFLAFSVKCEATTSSPDTTTTLDEAELNTKMVYLTREWGEECLREAIRRSNERNTRRSGQKKRKRKHIPEDEDKSSESESESEEEDEEEEEEEEEAKALISIVESKKKVEAEESSSASSSSNSSSNSSSSSSEEEEESSESSSSEEGSSDESSSEEEEEDESSSSEEEEEEKEESSESAESTEVSSEESESSESSESTEEEEESSESSEEEGSSSADSSTEEEEASNLEKEEDGSTEDKEQKDVEVDTSSASEIGEVKEKAEEEEEEEDVLDHKTLTTTTAKSEEILVIIDDDQHADEEEEDVVEEEEDASEEESEGEDEIIEEEMKIVHKEECDEGNEHHADEEHEEEEEEEEEGRPEKRGKDQKKNPAIGPPLRMGGQLKEEEVKEAVKELIMKNVNFKKLSPLTILDIQKLKIVDDIFLIQVLCFANSQLIVSSTSSTTSTSDLFDSCPSECRTLGTLKDWKSSSPGSDDKTSPNNRSEHSVSTQPILISSGTAATAVVAITKNEEEEVGKVGLQKEEGEEVKDFAVTSLDHSTMENVI